MGRDRTKLQRALDLKPRAYNAFLALTGGNPAMRRALGFFPEYSAPADAKIEILFEDNHVFPLRDARYRRALDTVLTNNVETFKKGRIRSDEWSAQRVVALIDDVIVPGHTLTPVDAETARIIHLDRTGAANWGASHPGFVGLKRRHIPGVSLIIPPYKHYGHFLTDILFPHLFALGHLGVCKDEVISIITAKELGKPRPSAPIALHFVEAVRALGYRVNHVELSSFETAQLDKYLYAASHTPNGERRFAFPEAIAPALAAFRKLRPARPDDPDVRLLYIKRAPARLRQIEGEEALVERLKARGFHVFEPRWRNHLDQIDVFSRAEVIAGVHGGSLANVLWAKRGALLIEILANNARKTTGLHWASEAGIDYECLFGSDEGARQAFAIDAAKIEHDILARSEGRTRLT